MSDSSTSAAAGNGGILFLYRELWEQARGDRRELVISMLLLVGAQCVLLAVPFFAAKAIDTLQTLGAGGLHDAGFWLALVLAATIFSWLLHGPGRLLERNVSLAVRRRLANSLTERVLSLPLTWHEANNSAATVHRVQQSSHALSAFAQSQFIYLNSAVRLIGPVIALWLMRPVIGMAAIGGFIIVFSAVIGFDRAMIRLAHRENDAERSYSASVLESLGNSTTLLALRQQRSVMALLNRRLEAVFVPLKRSILLNEAKWFTVDVAARALSCSLVALFAWLALRKDAAIGQPALLLGSLYMVWEYAQQAGGVVSSFAMHFQTFARQQADYTSADSIREAMPTANESNEAMLVGNWQRYEIREVMFQHRKARTSHPTLDHASLTLERGKRYALIGGSGSGKSTLLRVLAGLYVPERIIIDQAGGPAIVSTSEAVKLLRRAATLIPQDAEVFEGSLADNLRMCASVNGAPSESEFATALKLAHVDDFIDVSASAMNTAISERGANWSGGQRARVALARGILAAQGSHLVLLDEPTASLDPATEAAVYENLFRHFNDACLISSIHRLHLLDRFDEVIVMHRGRIVAQGPAAALSATSPDFRNLLAAGSHHSYANVS